MSYLNFAIIFPLLKRSWHGIDYSYLYFIKRSEIHGYDKADLVTSLSVNVYFWKYYFSFR